MLRHFTLTSNAISYDGAYKAAVTFQNRPRCRAAIIGVSFRAVSPRYAHRNVVHALRVEGRNYVFGDPVPLSLIAPAPVPQIDDLTGGTPAAALAALTNIDAIAAAAAIDGTADNEFEAIADPADAPATADELREDLVANALPAIRNNFQELADQNATQRAHNAAVANALASLAAAGEALPVYFPGSLIPLRDGRRVGGILIHPNQRPTMEIEDLSDGSAPILYVVLHCVEFPEQGQAGRAATALWQRFATGEGEVQFHGVAHSYSAAFSEAFDNTPIPQNGNLPMRRLVVRGLLHNATAVVYEAEFRALTAELSTASQKPPHDQPAPAREVIGHTGLEWHYGEADLHQGEAALVRVAAASNPAAARVLRLCSVFEGRNPAEEFQGTASL